jgi:hypothetical protein
VEHANPEIRGGGRIAANLVQSEKSTTNKRANER